MNDSITTITTEISLAEIINDWFDKNQYGDIWAGGQATPDTWVLHHKLGHRVNAHDHVVRFTIVKGLE